MATVASEEAGQAFPAASPAKALVARSCFAHDAAAWATVVAAVAVAAATVVLRALRKFPMAAMFCAAAVRGAGSAAGGRAHCEKVPKRC